MNPLILLIIILSLTVIGLVIALIAQTPPPKETFEQLKYNPKQVDNKATIVKASRFNSPVVTYRDNVYILRGHGYTLSPDSIVVRGSVKMLHPGDYLLGEEAPGFMRLIMTIQGNTLNTRKAEMQEVVALTNSSRTHRPEEMLNAMHIHPKRREEFHRLAAEAVGHGYSGRSPSWTREAGEYQVPEEDYAEYYSKDRQYAEETFSDSESDNDSEPDSEPENYEEDYEDDSVEDFNSHPEYDAAVEEYNNLTGDYDSDEEDYDDDYDIEDYKADHDYVMDLLENYDTTEFFEMGVVEGYEENFNLFKSIGKGFKSIGKGLKKAVKGIGKGLKKAGKWAKKAAKNIGRKLKKGLKDTGKWLKKAGKNIKKGFEKAGKWVKKAAKSFVKGAKAIGRAIKGAAEWVGKTMMKGVNFAIKIVRNGIEFLGKMAKALLDLLSLKFHKTVPFPEKPFPLKYELTLPDPKPDAARKEALGPKEPPKSYGKVSETEMSGTVKINLDGALSLSSTATFDITIGLTGPSHFRLHIETHVKGDVKALLKARGHVSKGADFLLVPATVGLVIPVFVGVFIMISPSLSGQIAVDLDVTVHLGVTCEIYTVKPAILDISWDKPPPNIGRLVGGVLTGGASIAVEQTYKGVKGVVDTTKGLIKGGLKGAGKALGKAALGHITGGFTSGDSQFKKKFTAPKFVATIKPDHENKIELVITTSIGLQVMINVLLEGVIGFFIGLKPYFVYTFQVAIQDCSLGGKKIFGFGGKASGSRSDPPNGAAGGHSIEVEKTDICLAMSDKKALGFSLTLGGSVFGKEMGSATLINKVWDLGGASKALTDLSRKNKVTEKGKL